MFSDTKIGYSDGVTSRSNQQKPTFAQISAANNMISKLIVDNFGPIKHVDLDLRNVNVFIGPQATGKSALAKIYTIFKAPRKFFYKNDLGKLDNNKASKEFPEIFEDYNIKSFLKSDTQIQFDSELHNFSYKNGNVQYIPKLKKTIEELELLFVNFNSNKESIIKTLLILGDKFIIFSFRACDALEQDEQKRSYNLEEKIKNLNTINFPIILNIIKEIEEDLSTNAALYIPAERNFSNIIKKYSLNLILNKVPIPKHILSFGAELEKIELKIIPLNFIQKDLVYKNIDGEDRIYTNDEHSIMLIEAASGIQSVIPVLLPILSKRELNHKSFVIEEPELNLFPIAQYKLIQLLESSRRERESYWEDYGTIHTYTTHSPYILSALNNLLYANKVRKTLNERNASDDQYSANEKNTQIVKNIAGAEIDPELFTAYQISEGEAIPIFNRKTGLIENNYIDDASDKVNEDFESLMELIS